MASMSERKQLFLNMMCHGGHARITFEAAPQDAQDEVLPLQSADHAAELRDLHMQRMLNIMKVESLVANAEWRMRKRRRLEQEAARRRLLQPMFRQQPLDFAMHNAYQPRLAMRGDYQPCDFETHDNYFEQYTGNDNTHDTYFGFQKVYWQQYPQLRLSSRSSNTAQLGITDTTAKAADTTASMSERKQLFLDMMWHGGHARPTFEAAPQDAQDEVLPLQSADHAAELRDLHMQRMLNIKKVESLLIPAFMTLLRSQPRLIPCDFKTHDNYTYLSRLSHGARLGITDTTAKIADIRATRKHFLLNAPIISITDTTAKTADTNYGAESRAATRKHFLLNTPMINWYGVRGDGVILEPYKPRPPHQTSHSDEPD